MRARRILEGWYVRFMAGLSALWPQWPVKECSIQGAALPRYIDSTKGDAAQKVLQPRLWIESGEPTITAKIACAVKHLHRKSLCPAGVDEAPVCVDNYIPPIARDA